MVKDIALALSVILNFYLLYLRSKRSDESQKMLMSRLDDMEEYVHETKDETLKAKFREPQKVLSELMQKNIGLKPKADTQKLSLFRLGGMTVLSLWSLSDGGIDQVKSQLINDIELARLHGFNEYSQNIETIKKEVDGIKEFTDSTRQRLCGMYLAFAYSLSERLSIEEKPSSV
jgi:hypothetical protein